MLSTVIPVCNEEEVIPELLVRLKTASAKWGDYEIIFIDDGSTDRSLGLLSEAAAHDNHCRIISFTRNFGHQAAVTAGLESARGDAVVLMDADLQDPPELVAEMVARHAAGVDIVYAVRRTRPENILKRLLYKGYYRLFRYLAYIDVPLDAGDFCLMSRRVVDVLNALPERNRFVRGLRVWTGFSKAPLQYDRGKRAGGETKYPLSRLVRFGLAGIIAFSTRPLMVSIYAGVAIALASFTAGVILVILKLTVTFNVSGWASIVLVITFMGGAQLLILGILGQYIGLIYMETQQRPIYVVREKIGF